MSYARESDLFARSISGDWQSRVILYRKFVHENTRVRRLGIRYSNMDDFLNDVFTNVLRSSHTFQRGSRFSERVEAVAVWTALERERLREIDKPDTRSFVRMCAAIEGDEADIHTRLTSYVPPRSSPEDSLESRISAIVGEPQFTLICARAEENTTWESAASVIGRPVNTIGPVFVRAVERLLRFFGAPPPLNVDLEPVFLEVSAVDAAARHANPLKPRGRVVSMQLDPQFYTVTPEMRRIGLSIPAEVRTLALWDAAKLSESPGEALRDHLANCRYCADILRSFMLMQQAVRSGVNADFFLCPGASTLLRDPDEANDAFNRHLAECALCRDEQTRAFAGEEQDAASGSRTATTEGGLGKKIVWAAAAAIILCGILIAGLRHFAAQRRAASALSDTVAVTNETAVNTKFADLARSISVDDKKLLASVLPQNQLIVMDAMKYLKEGRRPAAKMIAEQLTNESNDPGAHMLHAECLYAERSLTEGYREMQKSEAIPPRNSFRCWATLQCALMAGDKETAKREIGHLSSDPEYGAPARDILARMLARK